MCACSLVASWSPKLTVVGSIPIARANKNKMVTKDIVEKFLPEMYPNGGKFLEIGCWDGRLISNTAYLETIGWTGVCVDPFPRNFEGRTCNVIPGAVAGVAGKRDFVKVTIDRRYGGDVSYFSGFLDTIDRDPKIWELIKEHCDYEIISVDTIAINDLLSGEHFDFLSIDTEGSELEILSWIDYDKYSFGVILVEHNNNEDKRGSINQLLTLNGYALFGSTDIDDLYLINNC